MTPRRSYIAGLVIIGLATALSLAVAVTVARAPGTGALEGRSDHFSTRNATALQMRLFGAQGVSSLPDIHRYAIRAIPGVVGGQGEAYGLRDQPDRPMLPINWSFMPRPYPPGAHLYHLPDAVLQEWFGASFEVSNAFTLCKYVLATAVLLLLLWTMLFRMRFCPLPGDEPVGRTEFAVDVALFTVLGLELLFWSLAGFFDVLGLSFIFGSIYLLQRKRPALALLTLMAAVSCHYRAVWYAPLGAYAVLLVLQAQLKRPGGWRALVGDLRASRTRPSFYLRVAGVLALVTLFLLSLWTFKLTSPFLEALPLTNPLRPGLPDLPVTLRLYVGFAVLLAGLGAWQRHFAFSATLLFTAVMLYISPLMQYWHSIWVFPMYAVALLSTRAAPVLRAPTFSWIAFMTTTYFDTHPFKFNAVREWIRLFTV